MEVAVHNSFTRDLLFVLVFDKHQTVAGAVQPRSPGAERRAVNAPSAVGYGEGCPLPSRLVGLSSHACSGVRGPGRKRILAYVDVA